MVYVLSISKAGMCTWCIVSSISFSFSKIILSGSFLEADQEMYELTIQCVIAARFWGFVCLNCRN